MHSKERGPLSTMSPLKRYKLLAEGRPDRDQRKKMCFYQGFRKLLYTRISSDKKFSDSESLRGVGSRYLNSNKNYESLVTEAP
jgi:hypothetical protein